MLYYVEERAFYKSISEDKLMNKKMRKLEKSDGDDVEKQIKLDRISNLSWAALDSVLVHLPLRDAARTSLLSSKWRYKWTGISEFVFDDKCFPSFLPYKARWEEIRKIMRHVQSNHRGTIEKFKLAACCQPDYSDLDEWIHFVTERGVKELIIQDFIFVKRFKLPSCLFSCPQLSRLELYGCIFKLPPAFKGFNCLKSLQLNHVSIISDILESLISSCPVLDRLTLLDVDHLASLRIHNQSLKHLKIDSEFEDICFESSPLLASVDIRMIPVHRNGRTLLQYIEQGKPCNLLRILGCLCGVKRLTLSSYFLEFLAYPNLPERCPIIFNDLSFLELKEVRFCSLKEVLVSISILRSSPSLEELFISIGDSSEISKPVIDYLRDQYPCDFFFNGLKVVRIRGICGTRPEWEFIKLILAHSPVLETMTIVKFGGERVPESLLLQVERASEHVKITSLTL